MKIGPFEINEPLPSMKEPHVISMLCPWINVGRVGSLTLGQLENHFGAGELGGLARPGEYFDFTRYRPVVKQVEDRRVFSVPNTKISYAPGQDGPDLLFFHILEPHNRAEEYTEGILELFKAFGVKRYCRIGGMYDAVPHTRPLLVTGTIAGKPIRNRSGEILSARSTYEGPTTILNVASEGAEKLGIENMTLMVHLPQYVQLEEDHAGVARLLEVLGQFYDIPSSLLDAELALDGYKEIGVDVEKNPAAKALVERLEANYDLRVGSNPQESAPLSPEVERFLQGIEQSQDPED